MYDFYVLSALPTWGLKSATRYARDADELEFVAKETLKKVADYLQKDLISAVYYAIECEFRHYLSFTTIPTLKKHKYRKFFEKYVDYVINNAPNPYTPQGVSTAKEIFDADKWDWMDTFIDAYFFLNKEGRDISEDAIKKSGIRPAAFVDIAEYVFNEPIWREQDYGGRSWAAICAGWKKLNSANNLGDQIVYIDHVFDLQHNTDTVLNKCKEYADDSRSHRWISIALDDKKKARSLFDLTKNCSPSLKYFAARVIKAATGETFESYTDKKYQQYVKELKAFFG